MRGLALHQITAMEAAPPDLAAIAAEVGCNQVCVFVRSPLVPIAETGELKPLFPTITRDTKAAMEERLSATGVTIMNVEYFPIEADTDVESYRDPLELAGDLGAQRAVTHVHDIDETCAVAKLRSLCDLAAEFGLSVGLEFMGLSPGCNTLAKARQLVEQANRPNLGIAIDALHLVRTGGQVEEVATLDPAMIAYVQLCDGTHFGREDDYLPEALNRLAPGEGVFPLLELIRALPSGVPMDVEVPSEDLQKQGVPPRDRAFHAVQASRTILRKAGAA